jgi:hypothetical protein
MLKINYESFFFLYTRKKEYGRVISFSLSLSFFFSCDNNQSKNREEENKSHSRLKCVNKSTIKQIFRQTPKAVSTKKEKILFSTVL